MKDRIFGSHSLFSQFDTGVRAHIAWEEEILFPPFEEKTGMRMEHQQIKQLLQTIEEKGSPPDG